MTHIGQLDGGPPRVIVQYLEGGAASGAIGPDAAAMRLRQACEQLPISDVCLGWNLPLQLIRATAAEARHQGATVWLWHPFLSGDGRFVPSRHVVLGPFGSVVAAPDGMGEFTFDCPVRPDGLDAALARLTGAMSRFAWDGVFLDKIRWPSPSSDPVVDMGCFCDACRAAAMIDDIDLQAVATALSTVATTPEGRFGLVATLLGGPRAEPGPVDDFLTWRCGRISSAVAAAADLVRSRRGPDGKPMRVALDIFSPALARSVGQDIAALAPLAEFTKAMLYLGTHGPAGLPYELCGLARWLAEGGLPSPVERLAGLLGYPLPDAGTLCRAGLGMAAFEVELARLREQAGPGSAAGIDAVRIADLAVIDDATLGHALRAATTAGLAIVLSWDLWSIPAERLPVIAQAITTAVAPGAPA